jgi:hypothetical protein
MQNITIEHDVYISARFEPCIGFVTTDDGQVCEACGWLADEHASATLSDMQKAETIYLYESYNAAA